MNLKRISHCAAVLATVLLTPHVQAADNLHFYGNLLSKSCTLVVQGESLAEVHFPTVSRKGITLCCGSSRKPPDGVPVVVSVSVGFGLLLQAASNIKRGSNVT